MAARTNQKELQALYDRFADYEVTFSKVVAAQTGLVREHIELRLLGARFPCVLLSASMRTARVIALVDDEFNRRLRFFAHNIVALRLCFRRRASPEPVAFFIQSRSDAVEQYDPERSAARILSLTYLQRPPADFIELVGRFLAEQREGRREPRFEPPWPATARGISRRAWLDTADGRVRCHVENLSRSGALVSCSHGCAPAHGNAVALTVRIGDAPVTMAATVRHHEALGDDAARLVGLELDPSRIPRLYEAAFSSQIAL